MLDSDGRRNNVGWPGRLRSFAWAVLAVSAATGDARAGAESLGKGVWVVQRPEACEAARIAFDAKSRVFSNEKLVVSRTNAPYHTLIRFDLADAPKGRPVKDAALFLYCCKQYHASPMVIRAYSLRADWRAGEATWTHRTTDAAWSTAGGDVSPEHAAQFEVAADYGQGRLPVRGLGLVQLVDQWLRDGQANHGLLLKSARAHRGPSMAIFHFAGAPKRELWPKLVISFDEPIDLAAQGYISDAELARRPLRERLKRMEAIARRSAADELEVLRKLARRIEQVGLPDGPDVSQLDRELGVFRNRLAQSLWPDRTFLAWPLGPWEEIPRDPFPAPGEVGLAATMLRGEYQEVSAAVTNLTDRALAVEAKPRLPPGVREDNVCLRASYWVKCRAASTVRGENAPVWIDDVLPRLRENRFLDLQAGETRRIWLTLSSTDLAPGMYEAELELVCSGGSEQLPLRIEVLPAVLKTDPGLHVFTYAYLNRPSTAKLMEVAVSDLKTHGQNTFVLPLYPAPEVDAAGNILGPVDFGPIRQYLRHLGHVRKVLFFWWWDDKGVRPTFGKKVVFGSPEWRKAFDSWLRQWRDMLLEEGFGYDRFAMYPMDESYDNTVWGHSEYDVLLRVVQEIRRVDPRIQVFANPVLFRKDDLRPLGELAKCIDIWAPVQSLYHEGDHVGWPRNYTFDEKLAMRRFFRGQRDAGKLLWSYQCDRPTKALGIGAYYRQFAWRAWRHGIAGLGLWSYNNIVKSSWDDFDGIPDFTMVYESRDAPPDVPRTPSEPLIPSRRWQVWRAGVQDYHLLQQAAGTSLHARGRIGDMVDRVLATPADPAIYREARRMLLALLTSGQD